MINSIYKRFTKAFVILNIAVLFLFASCESDSAKSSHKSDNPLLREVVVKEVVQTSSYTYILFKEEGANYWAAVSRVDDIAVGETYYFDQFMEMNNFHSKELDKTFESVYFIEVLSKDPIPSEKMVMPTKTGSNKVGDFEIEAIDPVEGGITISELYANSSNYDGKTIKIKGYVVKYTAAVMNKNWVHIQDGSRTGGNFDLTITTDATCDQGDLVVFEGKISLDRDFGYGYSYAVIMEDAKMLEIEKATSLQ